VSDIGKAAKFASTGQGMKAVEKLIPSGFAAPLRAYREGTQGVTTEAGNRVWDEQGKPYRPSAGETALKVFGVTSSGVAMQKERVVEAKEREKNWQSKRDKVYEMARVYYADPDPRAMQYIARQVAEYNQAWRDAALQGSSIPRLRMSEVISQGKHMRMQTPLEKKRARAA
jgi:hypothetical protein